MLDLTFAILFQGKSRDDSCDSAYTTRTNSMSSDYQR